MKLKLTSEIIQRVISLWSTLDFDQFANEIGLSATAVRSFRPVYNKKKGCFGVPMVDARFRPVGIRFRRADGRKFSLKGGSEGLFIPSLFTDFLKFSEKCLIIAEGFTDAAALVDLGRRNVIGRPSCTGGSRHIVELIRNGLPRLEHVLIVADNDEPGISGALRLATLLELEFPGIVVTVARVGGYKDVRDYVLNHEPLESIVWQKV